MGKMVESALGSFFSPSPQTSFTMRSTAQPFGQPQYMVACVTTATISSWLTPFALAFCRWYSSEESITPDAMSVTTVTMHFVLASMALWSHTSPNSTSSFRCAKSGAISPS